MEFWIGLVIFCLGCIAVERLLPKSINRIVIYILFMVLCFIAGFRFEIGWDYESYMTMFYNTEIDDIYPEISFRLISVFFREWGFDFQIIFVIFSILTSFFLWVGLRYYLKDWMQMTIAIVIYSLMLEGYWMTLSQIRQFLAIAIFVFAVDLFLKGNSLST